MAIYSYTLLFNAFNVGRVNTGIVLHKYVACIELWYDGMLGYCSVFVGVHGPRNPKQWCNRSQWPS